MRRLTLDLCKDGSPGVFDDPEGDLVLWEDVEKLVRERDEVRGEVRKLQEELRFLTSELESAREAERGQYELWKEARAEVARLREGLEDIRSSRVCSDGNCIWGHPGGLHTNGGCQSLKDSSYEARKEVQLIAREIRALLDGEGGGG